MEFSEHDTPPTNINSWKTAAQIKDVFSIKVVEIYQAQGYNNLTYCFKYPESISKIFLSHGYMRTFVGSYQSSFPRKIKTLYPNSLN